MHQIIIGQNKGWKQEVNLKSQTNQNFTQIPFAKFIQMIQYKAEEKGIAVTLTEESYTSGTSFIDNEQPTKEFYNKSRRKHRGMFKSNKGILINADLNGAYQIMKNYYSKVKILNAELLLNLETTSQRWKSPYQRHSCF